MVAHILPGGCNMRIGLLGGSFDPAHKGHLRISQQAIKRLNLDKVVWLVSPQNPLKCSKPMQNLRNRSNYARILAQRKDIIITDLEKELGSCYTVDTISRLKLMYPLVDFIWIMGADNMVSFHKWYKWQHIVESIPVCVFDRSGSTYRALWSKMAALYQKFLITSGSYSDDLSFYDWYFFRIECDDISSTQLRNEGFYGTK